MRIVIEENGQGHFIVKREDETSSVPSWLDKFQGMPVWVIGGQPTTFKHAGAALSAAAELMNRLENTPGKIDFTKMVIEIGDKLRVTETHSHNYIDDNDVEHNVEVPEGAIVTATKIIDNGDEITVCFVYQGHELMSPSDCFVRHEP